MDYEFSEHAHDMLRERNIQEEWVKLALEDPQRKEFRDDGTIHHIRSTVWGTIFTCSGQPTC